MITNLLEPQSSLPIMVIRVWITYSSSSPLRRINYIVSNKRCAQITDLSIVIAKSFLEAWRSRYSVYFLPYSLDRLQESVIVECKRRRKDNMITALRFQSNPLWKYKKEGQIIWNLKAKHFVTYLDTKLMRDNEKSTRNK